MLSASDMLLFFVILQRLVLADASKIYVPSSPLLSVPKLSLVGIIEDNFVCTSKDGARVLFRALFRDSITRRHIYCMSYSM
jgi:hypothetical protein